MAPSVSAWTAWLSLARRHDVRIGATSPDRYRIGRAVAGLRALGMAALAGARPPSRTRLRTERASEQTATARRPATPARPADTADDPSYVSFDAATKTVTFRLVAGPFDFNGFGNGGGTLTVPPGSTNV